MIIILTLKLGKAISPFINQSESDDVNIEKKYMNTQDMFNMSCSDSVQEYHYVPVTQPKLGATFMLRHIVTDFDILHAKQNNLWIGL